MILNVKKGRVWLKNNKVYRGKFIEVFLENGGLRKSFLACISGDGRLVIPLGLIRSMNIRDRVKIENIKVLKNKPRSNTLFIRNRINVLSFIPKNTLSGYEILSLQDKGGYLCWFCAKGRPNEVRFNKLLPLEFVKLLGYFQAEGGKPKLTKRRGREFNFTNKNFEIIKTFIYLSNHLFDKSIYAANINYKVDVGKNILIDLKDRLNLLGINHVSLNEVKRVKNYTITLRVSNSILAETISNMNDLIIKQIKNNRILFDNYFQGYIAGDGNYYAYRDKNGSLHSRLYLFESNLSRLMSFRELLEKYGLRSKIKKDKRKNFYILTSILNWDMLLNLMESDLLAEAHHKTKLIWTIQQHKRYKTLKIFPFLSNKFSKKKLFIELKKDSSYLIHWIEDRKKEGLIFDTGDKTHTLGLTNKGKKLKNILSKLPSYLE